MTECVHDLVASRAREHPDRIALLSGSTELTYGELNTWANRVAHRLIEQGVGPDVAVGVYIGRSIEFVVSVLAILKAGGNYVPLDPDYPAARIELMVATANAPIVITTEFLDLVDRYPATDPAVVVTPEHLAYAMFTSGSTGVPKCVSVAHRGIVRLVQDCGYVQLDEDEVLLQLSSTSFDAATFEIWGALTNGARLVIAPAGQLSVVDIGHLLQNNGITTAFFTTGLFHVLVDECLADLAGMRQVLAGGDTMSPSRAHRLVTTYPGCRLVNGYGPTEVTTFTTCHQVTADQRPDLPVPIGRPIRNTVVRILDENMNEVPAGMLYAGGDGVARGYLGDPVLTAQRFVPDPWSPGQRLYVTGDLAERRPDGTVMYLGRADQQVKRRGFRIEPGEIEEALRRDPDVRDAAIVAEGANADDKVLVAYVVTTSGDVGLVRERLRERLPAYLIPDRWVVLPELPLNANGKVDRRALAEVAQDLPSIEEPRDGTEATIAAIWCDIFELDRIGRHDDFFELGGHSLLASRMIARIRHSFGLEMPLRAVFDHPTVAGVAELVSVSRS